MIQTRSVLFVLTIFHCRNVVTCALQEWDRDEDHLALIAELLGDLPDKVW